MATFAPFPPLLSKAMYKVHRMMLLRSIDPSEQSTTSCQRYSNTTTRAVASSYLPLARDTTRSARSICDNDDDDHTHTRRQRIKRRRGQEGRQIDRQTDRWRRAGVRKTLGVRACTFAAQAEETMAAQTTTGPPSFPAKCLHFQPQR